MNVALFQKNRARFPAEKLAQYAGKFVAWSPDATIILAADEDELRLAAAIQNAGYNSAEVLIAFVPVDDEVLLGGGLEVSE